MCKNLRKTNEISMLAYKAVFQTELGYYKSPATGVYYDEREGGNEIPEPEDPNKYSSGYRISSWFCELKRILMPYGACYNEDLVGRTAGFLYYSDCKNNIEISAPVNLRHKIKIIEVKISNDLMVGTYKQYPVVAGRWMEILGEA